MGAGLPLHIPAMLAENGYHNFHTKLVIKVSSAKAAKLIFQYWTNKYNRIPDAVVVEGPMAGGHLGFKPEELTGNLVPLSKLVTETVAAAILPFEEQFEKAVPVIRPVEFIQGRICMISCKQEQRLSNWELVL